MRKIILLFLYTIFQMNTLFAQQTYWDIQCNADFGKIYIGQTYSLPIYHTPKTEDPYYISVLDGILFKYSYTDFLSLIDVTELVFRIKCEDSEVILTPVLIKFDKTTNAWKKMDEVVCSISYYRDKNTGEFNKNQAQVIIKGGALKDGYNLYDEIEYLIYFESESIFGSGGIQISPTYVNYACQDSRFPIVIPDPGYVPPTPVDPVPTNPIQTDNFALNENMNYIVSLSPQIELSSLEINNGHISNKNISASIDYFDGLGRPVQSVQREFGSSYEDLLTYQEYDEFGRKSNTWLPIAIYGNSGSYNNLNVLTEKMKYTYPNESNPHSKVLYESSPMNRPTSEYGPGHLWHNSDTRAMRTIYTTNTNSSGENPCARYEAIISGEVISLKRDGFYDLYNPQTQRYDFYNFYVTKIYDEEENITFEFRNLQDQILLTRQVNNSQNYDTYYVYDDFGNLTFVLPPLASDALNSNMTWTETHQALNDYAYMYKYDERQRCIAKKVPGIDWEYYIYDKADKLIFSQDGENRIKGEWKFSISDVFNRNVLTGVCKNTLSHTTNSIKNVLVKAEWENTTNANLGYNITGVTLLNPVIYNVNYYDNYEFIGKNNVPASSVFFPENKSGYGQQYTASHKGLLTGTIIAQLNEKTSPDYLYSVMYYDYRGRMIQAKSTNHLGGYEKEYVAYNFSGQPTLRLNEHSKGSSETKEYYNYTYDHVGRLIETKHKLGDNGSQILLVKNEYDNLGRLKKTYKGGTSTLPVEYTYNVRSWLNTIDAKSLFAENLEYLYSGNINSMQWKQEGQTRKYTYTYDNLSRLTKAVYSGIGKEDYNTAYTYDKHGNIIYQEQHGKKNATDYGIVDKLTLSYTGNQLKKITDGGEKISMAESADFKDNINKEIEYAFNTNGAMSQDLNKGISDIQYNLLNLPRQIDIKNPIAEARNEYTYSTTGIKLKASYKWNPNFSKAPIIGSGINVSSLTKSKTVDYIGNKIYEDGSLMRILVDGGYYDNVDKKYYFYLTDHLGNNRVVTEANANVIQRTHYYPFGMAFSENSLTEQGKQPYKYNGKELDHRHQLNLYDYSTRYMESAVGRFTSVDPLSEKYYSISPYAYCGNNPIKRIDPTGMWYDDFVYDQKGNQIDHIKTDNPDRHFMLHEKGAYSYKKGGRSQRVLRVLSQESILGDPRENERSGKPDGALFNGVLNDISIDRQIEIINEGIKNIDGYLSIISESARGSLDYKKYFNHGELINLNGIYMNNHEALNYLWGASMNEIMASGLAPMGVGDALIGAQMFHNWDSIFGASQGFFNQSNHNEAIKSGWWFNEARSRPWRISTIPKAYK